MLWISTRKNVFKYLRIEYSMKILIKILFLNADLENDIRHFHQNLSKQHTRNYLHFCYRYSHSDGTAQHNHIYRYFTILLLSVLIKTESKFFFYRNHQFDTGRKIDLHFMHHRITRARALWFCTIKNTFCMVIGV